MAIATIGGTPIEIPRLGRTMTGRIVGLRPPPVAKTIVVAITIAHRGGHAGRRKNAVDRVPPGPTARAATATTVALRLHRRIDVGRIETGRTEMGRTEAGRIETAGMAAERIARGTDSRLPIGAHRAAGHRRTGIRTTIRTMPCTTSDHRRPIGRRAAMMESDTEGIGMSRSETTQIDTMVPHRPGTSVAARRGTITVGGTAMPTEIATLRRRIIDTLDRGIVDPHPAMAEKKTADPRAAGTDDPLRPLRALMTGKGTTATVRRPLGATSVTTTN